MFVILKRQCLYGIGLKFQRSIVCAACTPAQLTELCCQLNNLFLLATSLEIRSILQSGIQTDLNN